MSITQDLPKIYVSDQESMFMDFYTLLLESNGYKVETFRNKSDLLERSLVSQPVLIISNIESTPLSGIDLLRLVKSNDSTKRIPFVVVSSAWWYKEKVAALGAVELVQKPFHADKLLQVVNLVLGKSEKVRTSKHS